MMGQYQGIAAGNWPLDGNSNDGSGNANNGTDSNVSYDGMGRFGSCASFNGSSSRIALPNNASLKPSGAFTVFCWYKGQVSANGTILENWCLESSKYYGYFLGLTSDGKPRVLAAKGTGTVASTDFSGCGGLVAVDDDAWHFIAARYTGSALTIYIDGYKDSELSWSGLVYTATQYPMIGVRQDSSGNYTGYIVGKIDNLVLLDYAMSSADIRRLYAYGKGCL